MKPGAISEDIWQISAASVLGKGHVDCQLPNQDAVAVVTNQVGNVICAVVSDGAGTASRSAEGSRIAADQIAAHMCLVGKKFLDGAPTPEAIRSEMIRSVQLVRHRLADLNAQSEAEHSLRDFHCTLVVWLFMPTGAFVAQIGDSVALSTRFAWVDDSGTKAADFFPDSACELHEVERGEYANETHFLTESDWQDHLRVAQLPEDVDAIVLMTDGAMDIAMLKGKVFRGFLSNLVGKLIATPEAIERDQTIRDWLSDPQTYSVTADDKTLLVAVRQRCRYFANAPVFLAQPPAPVATSHPATTPETHSQAPAPTFKSLNPIRKTPTESDRARTLSSPTSHPASLPNFRGQFRGPLYWLTATVVVLAVALATLALAHYGSQTRDSANSPKVEGHDNPAAGFSTARIPAVDEQSPPIHAVSAPATVSVASPEPTPAASNQAVATKSQTVAAASSASAPRHSLNIEISPSTPAALAVNGNATQTLSWTDGPSLTINSVVLAAHKGIQLIEDDQACMKGLVLDTSKSSCTVQLQARDAAPGTYKVRVEVDRGDGKASVPQTLSFIVTRQR